MPLAKRRAELLSIAALRKAREAKAAAAVRPAKGDPGRDGADGAQGERGAPGASVQGPKGDDGVGIASVRVEQEGRNATLVVGLSDGSEQRATFKLPRGPKGDTGSDGKVGLDQPILQMRAFTRPTNVKQIDFLPDGKLQITFTDDSTITTPTGVSSGTTVAALVTRDTAVDTTAVAADDVIRGTATCTVTLMAASTRSRVLHVKNYGSGIVTVAPAGSDTIDGAGSFQITQQFSSAMLIPNATGWTVV